MSLNRRQGGKRGQRTREPGSTLPYPPWLRYAQAIAPPEALGSRFLGPTEPWYRRFLVQFTGSRFPGHYFSDGVPGYSDIESCVPRDSHIESCVPEPRDSRGCVPGLGIRDLGSQSVGIQTFLIGILCFFEAPPLTPLCLPLCCFLSKRYDFGTPFRIERAQNGIPNRPSGGKNVEKLSFGHFKNHHNFDSAKASISMPLWVDVGAICGAFWPFCLHQI
jgi:hypothetical protein